jgi:positive regulator of sigma E activity
LIKLARIQQINADNVVLKLEDKTQCTDCKNGCSDGFLRFLFHKKNQAELLVGLNHKRSKSCHLIDSNAFFTSNNKVNDLVGLNFNESQLFKLALALYGLPILLMVASLLLSYWLFATLHLQADIGGLLGLVLGLLLSKYLINKNQLRYKPKVKFFK